MSFPSHHRACLFPHHNSSHSIVQLIGNKELCLNELVNIVIYRLCVSNFKSVWHILEKQYSFGHSIHCKQCFDFWRPCCQKGINVLNMWLTFLFQELVNTQCYFCWAPRLSRITATYIINFVHVYYDFTTFYVHHVIFLVLL